MSTNLRSVLVVCEGNTCRSPMAAALLGRILGGGVLVQSAGTETSDGLHAANDAVSVMRDFDIDISAHRSRSIDDIDRTRFDLMVAMTEKIARDLKQKFGIDASKIRNLEIRDPYGRGIDVYRSTAMEIEKQLRMLLVNI